MTPRLKGEGMGYPWNHSFCSAKEKVPLKYAKIGKNSEILPKKYSFSLVFLVKKYIFSEHFKLFSVAPLFCYPDSDSDIIHSTDPYKNIVMRYE